MVAEIDTGDVKLSIKWGPTDRGFQRGEFADKYMQSCSVQESSAASEECIWLGVDNTGPVMGNTPVNGRMHLTQEMVKDLIPVLQHFVNMGELPHE